MDRRAKAMALVGAASLIPLAALAQTHYAVSVPYSATSFPYVYVKTGTSLDIALEAGDQLQTVVIDKGSGPVAIVADRRWETASYVSAGALHLTIKPTADLPDTQMLTIPTNRHPYHVLLRSGPNESSTYTLAFYDRRVVAAVPTPKPTPRVFTIASCDGLDAHYRVHGDKRIQVDAVCDDGTRTFLFMLAQRGAPAALPYRVDFGGRQDQLVNPGFQPVPGDLTHRFAGEWILDGVYEHLALLADSSRGQIRTNIEHVTMPPVAYVPPSVAAGTPRPDPVLTAIVAGGAR